MLIITIYMHVYGNNMHYISSLQYLLYVLHMEKYVLLYVGILNTKFEVQWSSFKGYIYVLFYIFHVQVFYKIVLHKNTKIGLLKMARSWCPWKSQRIISKLISNNYKDVVNQKRKHLFYIIIFKVLCVRNQNGFFTK